jgi:peptidoglycan/xylan/chitin deacetylase (PgdA/CDA1 family)
MKLIDQDIPGPRRDYVGYGERTPKVFWPGEAKVAVSLYIDYVEGSEYSMANGDGRNEDVGEIPYNMDPAYRDLCVESVFEYGSRTGIWRLMDLFDEYQLKGTVCAAAVALERNPAVSKRIRQAGHEPCSHGWRWDEPWLLDRDEERERIRRTVSAFENTVGQRPLGWQSRYSPSVSTRELLVEEGGFLYDSDAYNDDLPYFTEVAGRRHLVVPRSLSYDDARFVLPQGFGSPGDFVEVCRRAFDELRREGAAGYPKMMSIALHPRWAGQAARTSAVREIIEAALNDGDVWLARRVDIADWWCEHHEEFRQ